MTFSSDRQHRLDGENALKQCETQRGYGVVLVSVLGDQRLPIHHRQMAGVVLRHYVETHWGIDDADTKCMVRETLPKLLMDNDTKICTTVGMCIGTIARTDFPTDWPNLLSQLLHFVHSGDSRRIEAGLWALSLVAEYLLEDQIMIVVQQLFPELLRIAAAACGESAQIVKSRAMRIYRTTVRGFNTITSISPHEKVVEELLLPTLDDWLTLMGGVLSPATMHHSVFDPQYGCRQEALKAVKTLVEMFPNVMRSRVLVLLPWLWQFLMAAVPVYDTSCVLSNDAVASRQYDVNGEEVSLPAHLAQLLEFMATVLQVSCGADVFAGKLDELVYAVLTYQQITQYEIDIWNSDADAFLLWEDVDHHAAADAVRTSAQEMLRFVFEKFPSQSVFASVSTVCQRRLNEAVQLKAAGHGMWWKRMESCFIALGILADCSESGGVSQHNQYAFDFDWSSLLQTMLFPLVDMTAAHTCDDYLRARVVWLISHVIVLLDSQQHADILRHSLAAITQCLSSAAAGFATRLSAARCFGRLCMTLESHTIQPYLSEGIHWVANILQQSSGEVLCMQLQTFHHMLDVNADITASVADTTIPLMLQVWRNHYRDCEVILLVCEVFQLLGENARTLPTLQAQVLPTLISTMMVHSDTTTTGNVEHMSHAIEGALKIIRQLLAACEQYSCPPSPHMYTQALPATVNLVLHSNSTDVVEFATKLLKHFVRVSPQAIHNANVLHLICDAIARLLDPYFDENAAWHVGDLLAQFLLSCGDMLDASVTTQLLVLANVRLNVVLFSGLKHNLIRMFARLFIARGRQFLAQLLCMPELRVPTVPSFAERYRAKIDALMYPRPQNTEIHEVNGVESLFSVWLQSVDDLSGYAERLSVCALSQIASWTDPSVSDELIGHILYTLAYALCKHQYAHDNDTNQAQPNAAFTDANAFFESDSQYIDLSDLLVGMGQYEIGDNDTGDDEDRDERVAAIDILVYIHEFFVNQHVRARAWAEHGIAAINPHTDDNHDDLRHIFNSVLSLLPQQQQQQQ